MITFRFTKGMLEGYLSELGARKSALEEGKLALESWYAMKIKEEMIVGVEREKYDDLVNAVDIAIRDFNSTQGAVKKAIVTRLLIFRMDPTLFLGNLSPKILAPEPMLVNLTPQVITGTQAPPKEKVAATKSKSKKK